VAVIGQELFSPPEAQYHFTGADLGVEDVIGVHDDALMDYELSVMSLDMMSDIPSSCGFDGIQPTMVS
jgi:hypothetical protein